MAILLVNYTQYITDLIRDVGQAERLWEIADTRGGRL